MTSESQSDMAVPEDKIYNDAPDEFAEFIDSGRPDVSLKELGGEDNPFVKEGIYKESIDEFCDYAYCPECGHIVCFNNDFSYHELITLKCGNEDCEWEFDVDAEDCKHYAIDHYALAEFMSKGLGCSVCRQFKKTGWQFGKLRGYDVYFACEPTDGMYRALESAPKSVLVIGQNNPKKLPSALATRVVYLSRLLYVSDGALHFADEVIEEKIPLLRERVVQVTDEVEKPAKRHARPPVQVYTPYYLAMMGEWLYKLFQEVKTGQPTKKWMVDWLYKHGQSFSRRRLSERQIYRHIEKLTAETPPPKGTPDYRSPVFAAHWNGCLDMAYVQHFSVEDLPKAISKAFTVAEKLGYKIKPMKSMDAADFADKVRNPNA